MKLFFEKASVSSFVLILWLSANDIFFAAETHHEHFVNFEEYDDEPTTCSSENQGQLTYRKDEGNLEMCEGAKWTRLATSNKKDFLKNLFWKIFFSAKS